MDVIVFQIVDNIVEVASYVSKISTAASATTTDRDTTHHEASTIACSRSRDSVDGRDGGETHIEEYTDACR